MGSGAWFWGLLGGHLMWYGGQWHWFGREAPHYLGRGQFGGSAILQLLCCGAGTNKVTATQRWGAAGCQETKSIIHRSGSLLVPAQQGVVLPPSVLPGGQGLSSMSVLL